MVITDEPVNGKGFAVSILVTAVGIGSMMVFLPLSKGAPLWLQLLYAAITLALIAIGFWLYYKSLRLGGLKAGEAQLKEKLETKRRHREEVEEARRETQERIDRARGQLEAANGGRSVSDRALADLLSQREAEPKKPKPKSGVDKWVEEYERKVEDKWQELG